MAAKPNDRITLEEARETLVRSGYLLETRLADYLRRRNYRVAANTAYPDPITGKSRELDLHANFMRSHTLGPNDDDMLWPELLIECVHPPQPIAFLTDGRRDDFLTGAGPMQAIHLAGTPVHMLAEHLHANWQWLPGLMELDKIHHYSVGQLFTQYCSFDRKRGNAQWMAHHREEEHEGFVTLCSALDHFIADFYRTAHTDGDQPRVVQICAYYPIMVIDGELLDVRVRGGKVGIRHVDHVRYHRSVFLNDEVRDYLIDVVTEKGFPRLLRSVDRELRVLAERASGRYEYLREILARHMANYKQALRKRRHGGRSKGPRLVT
jgi:hypothetical protein